jgi:hypothetical protein
MNDDRQFTIRLERWLDTRDAPVSASRVSEEILAALPHVRQDRRVAPGFARPVSRGTLRLLALAAVLTVGVVGATLVGGNRDTAVIPAPAATPTPTPAPTPTPTPNPYPEVVNRIDLGADTWQVVATPDRTWVQTGDVGASAVDPATGVVVAEVADVSWMILEGDELWMQKGPLSVLVRVDPLTGEELERFEDVPGYFLAKDGDTTWGVGPDGRILHTDLATGERLASIEVPAEPKQIVVAAGSVWVISDDGSALVRIDPVAGEITDTIDVGLGPVEIKFGFDSLWVRNRQLELVRVDAQDGSVVATLTGFPVSPSNALSFGDGVVWAGRPRGIAAIDPATNEIVREIPLPGATFMDSFWLDNTLWITTAFDSFLLEVDASGP